MGIHSGGQAETRIKAKFSDIGKAVPRPGDFNSRVGKESVFVRHAKSFKKGRGRNSQSIFYSTCHSAP